MGASLKVYFIQDGGILVNRGPTSSKIDNRTGYDSDSPSFTESGDATEATSIFFIYLISIWKLNKSLIARENDF